MARRDGIDRVVSPRTGAVTWRARASWIGPDGKRVHRSRSFPTKREATHWRRETLSAVHRGAWFEPARAAVADVAVRWLAGIERSRAPSTYRQYRHTWEHHVAPRIGAMLIAEVRATDLQVWYDELADVYAAESVKGVHKVVRGIMGHAVTDGIIRDNPADGRRLPKDRPHQPVAWTPDEARRFLAHIEPDDDALLYAVLLATGMRMGEALALRWEHVDLEARTLRVVTTLQYTVDGWRIGDAPKTEGSRRVVALPAVAVLALRRQRAITDSALVFAEWHGGTREPSTVRARLARLCVAAGVPTLTPHELRSTASTLMLLAGTPLKVAAAQSGHSVEMLLKRYQAVMPDDRAQAAAALDSLLTTRQQHAIASDSRHNGD